MVGTGCCRPLGSYLDSRHRDRHIRRPQPRPATCTGDATLTIDDSDGAGALIAAASDPHHVGIQIDDAALVVNNGTITATSGYSGPDIGGGCNPQRLRVTDALGLPSGTLYVPNSYTFHANIVITATGMRWGVSPLV